MSLCVVRNVSCNLSVFRKTYKRYEYKFLDFEYDISLEENVIESYGISEKYNLPAH